MSITDQSIFYLMLGNINKDFYWYRIQNTEEILFLKYENRISLNPLLFCYGVAVKKAKPFVFQTKTLPKEKSFIGVFLHGHQEGWMNEEWT